MKASELRQSILQAAVQGKLVPQNPKDEPASELLKRIRQEKARLIRDGKIKKEKSLPQISEEIIPYDLPDGWEWCQLTDIVSLYNGSIRRGPFGSAIRKDMFVPYTGMEYKVYEQGNAIRKTVDYGTYYISEQHYEKLKSFTLIPGDIIISCAGTLGETYIIPEYAPKGIINQALLKLNINSAVMTKQYFLVMFKAVVQQQIVLSSLGSAMKNLTSIAWLKESVVFPLPPIVEQERIIAKVEELMTICDELEIAENELDKLESNFVEYLPKSILQAAVQGKLVPQNIHDEPADELLKKIQQEKARLIRDGKIKKEKPLLPISEDDTPYDLPDSWSWCRLNDICSYIQRGKSPVYSEIKKYPVVAQKCNQWSGFSLEKAKFIEPSTLSKYDSIRFLQTDDLMWNSTGLGTLGRMAIYSNELNPYELAVADSHVTVIRPLLDFVLAKYLFAYFANPTVQNVIEQQSDGTTKQKELATSTVKNYLVPIPPLAEQQRIIAKLEEFMTLCDELKEAKTLPITKSPAKIIPFPQKVTHRESEWEIGIAARGDATQRFSDDLQSDIDDWDDVDD
jgi:type I restriction enzyme S subunit